MLLYMSIYCVSMMGCIRNRGILMGNLKHYYQALKSGDVFFDEYRKSALILGAVTILHAVFALFFLLTDVLVLSVYNIAVVAAYQGILLLIKKKRVYLAYILTCIEVVVHAILATLLVGFASGFQVYCVAMIAVSCYVTFTWECFKKGTAETLLFSLFSMFGYFGCYALSKYVEPFFVVDELASTIMYIVNALLMFTIIFSFMMLLFWDINHRSDKLAAKNSQLDEMSKKDPLTKLYNRRFMNYELNRRMSDLMTDGKIFGLIMADIDNFKKVNDTYGHEAGDDVLIAVANEFTNALRGDDCVCRWGGEEFLVIINGNHHVTGEVAERIRKRIEELSIETGGHSLKVTMTFGISESIPGLRVERLIQIADERLYKGKQSGKNCVIKE
ncbi:MAG: GGDEF domain-containing protein [Lachnospiraceae bacterium]|nr:GGDEF domain-containing protein [Lachnospiraceae bacterium]